MGAEDNFPPLPGDPAALTTAGTQLGKLGNDVRIQGQGIEAELPGMAKAWTGPAGDAANAETGTAGKIVKNFHQYAETGAKAFAAFGKALTTAQDEVESIRKQAMVADSDARAEVERARKGTPRQAWAPGDAQEIYNYYMNPRLNQLRIKYDAVKKDLSDAAKTQGAALTGAVPGWDGKMSAADFGAATRKSLGDQLPLLKKVLDAEARAASQKAATDLAGKVKPYLEKGQAIPPELLADIEKNKADQVFAKTFLETLGGNMPGWAVKTAIGNGRNPADDKTVKMFADLLTVGSQDGPDRLSDKYLDEMLAPLGPDKKHGLTAASVQEAWYLSTYLQLGGKYGTHFLDKVGEKFDVLARDENTRSLMTSGMRPHGAASIPTDPMESYFKALGKNADAAGNFFGHQDDSGKYDRLRFYMFDRDLPYPSTTTDLGDALVAATSYHNGEESGKRSASIAQALLSQLGDKDKNWLVDHDRQQLEPALAKMMTGYADDIYYNLALAGDGGTFGLHQGNPKLGNENWGIGLTDAQIRQLFGQIDHDVKAYGEVVTGLQGSAGRYLDAELAAAKGDPKKVNAALETWGSQYGRVMASAFNVHFQVQKDLKQDQIDDHEKKVGIALLTLVSVAGVVGTGLPFFLPATVGFAGRVAFGVTAGATLPWIIDAAGGETTTEATERQSDKTINAWAAANRFTIQDRIYNSGVLDGTTADAKTFVAQQKIAPDESFLGADGKVLPLDKLDGKKLDNYLKWHQAAYGVEQSTGIAFDAMDSQNPTRWEPVR